MDWLTRMQRRFGRYAIHGLMRYIVAIMGLVYVFMLIDPYNVVVRSLMLDPAMILRGEVWRLVTFIFIPPNTTPLWIIFILYFYYTMGTSLEQEWGSFKFNLFYLVGIVATAIAGFITGQGATSLYLNLSLFLAFAFVFPEHQIMLFLILPIKVKYLAILNGIFLGWSLLYSPWPHRLMIIAALVNYGLFFGKPTWNAIRMRRRVQTNRRRVTNEKIKETPAKHQCALCGKTEISDPKATFHICEQCDGAREYCDRHIGKHPHKTRASDN